MKHKLQSLLQLFFILSIGIIISSCGAKLAKPLSDSDIKKLENAITFEDTDMDEGEIGGEVSFDSGDVKIDKNATDLVFVLATDDSNDNISCSKGTEIGSVANGAEAGPIGNIAENTAFEDGSFIMLCLRNSKFTEKDPTSGDPLPNTVYSGLKSAVLVDNFEEPVEEPAEEPAAATAAADTNSADTANNVVDVVLPVFDHVLFGFDKYDVSPEFENMIMSKLGEVDDLTIVRLIVEGHADERGSNEYNLALGEKRAEAVKRVLIRNGIADDKITTVSYGEENPVDYSKTEEGYAKNRRSVIIIGTEAK